MSSTYYVLCASHDPALVVEDYTCSEDAEEAISRGYSTHPHCDFLISRVSGAPIEIGCPGTPVNDLNGGICHGHINTEWISNDWLRLLAHVQADKSDWMEKLRRRPNLRCWTSDRINRLRIELGMD